MFKKLIIPVLLISGLVGASLAFAGSYTKTLTAPYTVTSTTYATALSANVSSGSVFPCPLTSGCTIISADVTLKDANQANVKVKVLVGTQNMTLTKTTNPDGSLKYSGAVVNTGGNFTIKVQLAKASSANPNITLDPASGDLLKVEGASNL